ncbi:glycosyltransferase family 2 protein [Roseimaritima ulvae]|uniref:Glycosyltransferase EpsH n=1 Tax=Roseimaritima ulvae TaxID=980254 RepID=A0A5B9QIZ5_9BACT|nr:glycosyltransferase family 2 protein [Roseimaritima ulvae]QEG39008.1 Putative glycosyltransferase EpsH [Roseimaritima ulvae]
MPLPTLLSVVLPVRDCQHRIIDEVERVLDALAEMLDEPTELMVVDDGSRDATPDVLAELQRRHSRLRVTRHARPRGMEAAGQTGLEKSTGEVVFIQETDAPLRLDDLRRLYEMSRDESVVAARAQSISKQPSGPLMRRLRAWGGQPQTQPSLRPHPGLQMVRRPHLQQLATPAGQTLPLQAERVTLQQQR